MAKTMSMTGNQNHDDASRTYRIRSCDPWSDVNHDVLFLVMMQLGVVDFLAFSRVCKSWRSFALNNRNKFIVSRPPMSVCDFTDANEKEYYYLKDFEGRKLKIILPLSDRTCIGVTCGYLILFGVEDFWLVNPIKRHELYFPAAHFSDIFFPRNFRAILVFSPSISRWVFVVVSRYCTSDRVWFSVVGKQEWTYVSTPFAILDLHAFKGKIYTLHPGCRLFEVRLFPTPKVTLLEIKNFPKPSFNSPKIISLGKNLYVMDRSPNYPYNIQEIDLCKMEWVSGEKIGEECAFFCTEFMYCDILVRPESWADIYSQYGRYAIPDECGRFFYAKMWYFFHDCLNVNLLHD